MKSWRLGGASVSHNKKHDTERNASLLLNLPMFYDPLLLQARFLFFKQLRP